MSNQKKTGKKRRRVRQSHSFTHQSVKKIKKKSKGFIRPKDVMIGLLMSSLVMIIISFVFLGFLTTHDSSMKPTLMPDDGVIYSRLATYRRFDLVVVDDGETKEVRRIIGLPGESIKYTEDSLYVNDELIDEKFLFTQINEASQKGDVYTQSNHSETTFLVRDIPDDAYLLLGDNRPNATDSRYYGLVTKEKIKGKVLYKCFPLKEFTKF